MPSLYPMLSKFAFLASSLLISVNLQSAEPPPFTGENFHNGETITLADFSGKVVFLDFWASWCPPCIESLPAWEKMRNSIGTENFELIAVNVDENPEDGEEFLNRFTITYPVIFDPEGEIGIPYGIRSLPASFIINKNGEIVEEIGSFASGDEVAIQAQIEQLIAR